MNPEIRRHGWLDLGLHRLAIAPLVLAVLAAIPMLAASEPAGPLAWGASGLFIAVTIGWGGLRALASVADEVRDRTWDFQRMAALTPWQMALGKVLGAPLYQWYVGAWCLAMFVLAGARAGLADVGSRAVALVAAAVLLHALAVALSAAGARLAIGERARRGGGIAVLLGLLQLAPVVAALGIGDDPLAFVRWWGWRMPLGRFAAASTVLFAAWALLAAWRTMARELREPMRPWAWPAFAAFAALWWAGLSTPTMERPSPAHALALAALVLGLGAYLTCLLEPLTPVALSRLLRAWRPGAAHWQPRVPGWALYAPLAVVLGALAFVPAGGQALAHAALPVALLALRDVAVVGCFALLSPARSPVGRALFYIVVADLLLPGVALAVHQPGLARACFPLLGLLDPDSHSAVLGATLHAALAVAALWLAIGRARRDDA